MKGVLAGIPHLTHLLLPLTRVLGGYIHAHVYTGRMHRVADNQWLSMIKFSEHVILNTEIIITEMLLETNEDGTKVRTSS